jgi:hypothetical protein
MPESSPSGSSEPLKVLLDAADPLRTHNEPHPDVDSFLRQLDRDDGNEPVPRTPPRRRRRIAAIWTTVVLVGLAGSEQALH